MTAGAAVWEVQRLGEEHVERAGAALSRAFLDDPLFVWVEPDEDKRRPALDMLMLASARYGHLFGHAYTTPQAQGAAIWLPPGETSMSAERSGAAGFNAMGRAFDGAALARLGSFLAVAGALHAAAAPREHWYLFALAVDPSIQGRGAGSALVSPILARADHEGLPCYLETHKERNVTFYRGHGFEIVVDAWMPDGTLRYWTMRREPRD